MISMTPRERMTASITFQSPDKVPCEVRCTSDMNAEMIAARGDENYMAKFLTPMLARFELETPGTWIKPGYYRDVFGVVWNRTLDKNYGIAENTQITPDNLNTYIFPEPMPDKLVADLNSQERASGQRYRLARLNLSLWERAWTLRGMENLLTDLAMEPDFAAALFSKVCDYNCSVLKKTLKCIPVDGVHFGDDWGTQLGLQISPAMWRTFIKPHIKQMYQVVRDAGKFVSIHSCGKVQELFDELVDLGVNTFNPFQPEVMDVDAAYEKYFGRLCFWGGISTQVTLPFGTPQEVYAETKHLIDMGRRGGMIVSPAHSVPPGCKPENMIAMLEAMRDHHQGK